MFCMKKRFYNFLSRKGKERIVFCSILLPYSLYGIYIKYLFITYAQFFIALMWQVGDSDHILSLTSDVRAMNSWPAPLSSHAVRWPHDCDGLVTVITPCPWALTSWLWVLGPTTLVTRSTVASRSDNLVTVIASRLWALMSWPWAPVIQLS